MVLTAVRRPRTLRARLALLYGALFGLTSLAVAAVAVILLSRTVSMTSCSTGPGAPDEVSRCDHEADLSFTSAIGNDPKRYAAFVAAIAVLSLLGLGLGWLIAGRLLRPLRTITTTARAISARDLHQRLAIAGPDDEFRQLGQTLDGLFERLEASFQAQRNFVANASHELRTPVAAERTVLQVAITDPQATIETLRAAGRTALAWNSRQERLIDALLTLAGTERGIETWALFDLADLTADTLADGRQAAGRRDISIDADLSAAPAAGDPDLAATLIANLLTNAVRHNMDRGRVTVSTGLGTGGRAVLRVTNTGPPVPPGEIDRLFQPFQRLGGPRLHHTEGHGLGLAIVRAVVDVHDAELTAVARPEGGLDITVSFGPVPMDRWA